MLQIVMPTSYEDELVERLAAANERHAAGGVRVAEFYGSLPRTATGSGRPARSLTPVTDREFARHVEVARAAGILFTYAFNTSCTGNREFAPQTRRAFVDALLRARDLGCHAIVVASPYLIELARLHAPELRVHSSSIAFMKSTKEALHYVRLGAARLVLDPDTIRDFTFLRKLRRACPDVELEALCNHPCLLNCPYETYCYNSVAHASTAGEGGGYEPFALLSCHLDKLRDTAEFVKGSWMRPQDLHHYEDVGLSTIKIAGRGRSTAWLARVAEAYLSRHYDGNLMELIWEPQWTAAWRGAGCAQPPRMPLRADAAAFDGFIEHFVERGPDCGRGCGACRHCDDFAHAALSIDQDALATHRRDLDAARQRMLELAG